MTNPTKHSFARSLLLSTLLGVLGVANAFTQTPGTPDLSFGDGGLVRTPVSPGHGHRLEDLVVQADGKIIAVGYFFVNVSPNYQHRFLLVRYNYNGTLDNTFGDKGVSAVWFGAPAKARSAVVQSDGTILVTGEFQGNVAIARYLTNGTLDTSFGVGGIVTKDLADPGETSDDMPSKIIARPEGKFLVVAVKNVYPPQDSPDQGRSAMVITAHNADGSLDGSFGINGVAKKSLALRDNQAWHVFEGIDGSIFVQCSGSGPADPDDPHGPNRIYDNFIQKFTPDGNAAINFGRRGTLRFFDTPSPTIIKTLPNRQILAGMGSKLLLYNSSGSYAGEIFAGNEIIINGIRFWPGGVMLQNDGKIISSGMLPPGWGRALVRYLPNGAVDTTFGTNGISLVNPAFVPQEGTIFKIMPDGKILGAATTNTAPSTILLVRHHGDSAP